MRRIAVIGLGRFGTALARSLAESGVQVVGIDCNEQLVSHVRDEIDLAVSLDSTDEAALLSQEIDKVDVCVIAIGENFEASLLTTVLVKQMGVPHIVCRAQSELHAEIFRQIGADEVVQPELEAGAQTARQLANPRMVDFIPLSQDFTLLELKAPRAFHDKTIKLCRLREDYGVNLVVIERLLPDDEEDAERQTVVMVPRPNDVILEDDVLYLVGPNDSLARLPKE